MSLRAAGLAAALATATSCSKAPLQFIEADFVLADATWFAEEDTLFLFWDIQSEQGLGPDSTVEVRYLTDAGAVEWTPLSDLTPVHQHRPADCGPTARCGSYSLVVTSEPRDVQLRLRYHRDGESTHETDTVFNVVGRGEAHTHRSLLVYGVFDESNTLIQWRTRHQFPTLRNEAVRALGLRRELVVQELAYGTAALASADNPYGYGVLCPGDFEPAEVEPVRTVLPGVFHREPLPEAMATASAVCASAIVTDGRGEYARSAIARKNPEVRSAFPVLNSPVEDATPLGFVFGPCADDPVSMEHEAMQRQRLQLEDVPTTCIDDPNEPDLVERLVATIWDAVEAERDNDHDMVLVVAVNHDDDDIVRAVEQALSGIVPRERHRSSPRIAGAFVLDSTRNGLREPRLENNTLWCPTYIDESEDSARCPAQPDQPDADVGPIAISELPIFPDRDQYLAFLEDFDADEGGGVSSLTFRVPRFATTTEHYDVGEYGVMTFLNQESISAGSDDAFSFCAQEEPAPLVFSSPTMRDPIITGDIADLCAEDALNNAICEAARVGSTNAEGLVRWHQALGEANYDVGMTWSFPFLLRMEYETVVSGGATLLGYTVPFGRASPDTAFLGADAWIREAFPLAGELTQCRRFCNHPTFDSAGVYQPTARFRSTYASACYAPAFPAPNDLGFPRDP